MLFPKTSSQFFDYNENFSYLLYLFLIFILFVKHPLCNTVHYSGSYNCVNCSFLSYIVYFDNNLDAEGNYTLIALDSRPTIGLYPIAYFVGKEQTTNLPVSEVFFKFSF